MKQIVLAHSPKSTNRKLPGLAGVTLIYIFLLPFFTFEAHAQCDSGFWTSPSSGTFSSSGGTGSFYLNSPEGCYFYAIADFDCTTWIGNLTSSTSGTITFTLSPNNSCSSRSCTIDIVNASSWVVASFTVTQLGQGTVSQPDEIQGPDQLCEPEAQTYSIPSVSGASNYNWSYTGEGTISGSSTTITLNPVTSGLLSVSASDNCGSGPSQTLDVALLDIPVAPDTIMMDSVICLDENQTFSIPPVPQSENYTWTYNGEEIYAGADTTMSFIPTVDGTLSVAAMNICGEGPENTRELYLETVPEQPGPIVGDSILCVNAEPIYTIDPVQGAENYLWSLPSSWTGSSDSTSLDAAISTEGGILEVVAINECGPSTGAILDVNIATIPVDPSPISGPEELCAMEEPTYSISSVGDTIEYLWTLPDGWEGAADSSSIDVTANDTSGVIQVQLYDGCSLSQIESINVMVDDTLSLLTSISGSIQPCVGDAETYTVDSDPNADSYQWILPDSWSGTSSGSSIEIIAGSTGEDTVRVKAINHCDTSEVQTLNVVVNSTPGPLTSISGDSVVCMNNQHIYTTDSDPEFNYYWTMTGAIQNTTYTNENELEVTWNDAGQQTISVQATNDCGTGPEINSFVEVELCTSVEELTRPGRWILYPNPVGDILYLSYNTSDAIDVLDLEIYDLSGRRVLNQEINKVDLESEAIAIDVSALKRGSFILRLRNSNDLQSLPFVKY